MKIGVGVITMGLRPIHDYLLAPGTFLYVYTDIDRKGPAHARNQVLRHLLDEGCDIFFLFDDDCYPRARGWETYFIDQHLATDLHFFGLPDTINAVLNDADGEIAYWNGVLGCFGMFTRQMLSAIGFYNTGYKRYGHEDTGYTFRAIRSGLAGPGQGFPSPIRALGYIHSQDVYGETAVQNLTTEEKGAYIRVNEPLLHAEVNGEQIYYPFDQDHT